MLMMICLTTSVGALRLNQTPHISTFSYPTKSSNADIVHAPHTPVEAVNVGKTHSINRLWIRISKVSQVLLPSPQGVFLVVTFRLFVGRRTGPLTRKSLDFARSMSSWQTFSRDCTFREVRVTNWGQLAFLQF